jgi:hypothetical protein
MNKKRKFRPLLTSRRKSVRKLDPSAAERVHGDVPPCLQAPTPVVELLRRAIRRPTGIVATFNWSDCPDVHLISTMFSATLGHGLVRYAAEITEEEFARQGLLLQEDGRQGGAAVAEELTCSITDLHGGPQTVQATPLAWAFLMYLEADPGRCYLAIRAIDQGDAVQWDSPMRHALTDWLDGQRDERGLLLNTKQAGPDAMHVEACLRGTTAVGHA